MPSVHAGVLLVARSLIVGEDGRFLLVKRAATDRHHPSKWECPGGKLDSGEDLAHTQEREAKEETGLTIETLVTSFYTDSHVIRDGSEYDGLTHIAIFSIAQVVGGVVQLSEEHEDATWASWEEALDRELTPEVHRAVIEFSYYIRTMRRDIL